MARCVSSRRRLLLLTLLCLLGKLAVARPRVHVADALDDVDDSEETAEWKQWGKQEAPKPIVGTPCASAAAPRG